MLPKSVRSPNGALSYNAPSVPLHAQLVHPKCPVVKFFFSCGGLVAQSRTFVALRLATTALRAVQGRAFSPFATRTCHERLSLLAATIAGRLL